MGFPALPVLAVLLSTALSVPAAAQPVPGTKAPQSGSWGTDGCKTDPWETLQKVFDIVLAASGYDDSDNVCADDDAGCATYAGKRTRTQLVYDRDGKILKQWGMGVAGSRPPQKYPDGTYAVVAAGPEIFEICHSVDELAFFVGHEIVHLRLNHIKKRDDKKEELAASGRSDAQSALDGFIHDQEGAADDYGTLLAQKAGYNPGSSAAMLHLADLEWAKCPDGTSCPFTHKTYDPPLVRGEKIRAFEQRQAAPQQ